MPLNGVIARIALRGLYLLFEGKKFEPLICLKWVKLAQKCLGGLVDFNILPSNDTVTKIVLLDLDLLFRRTFEALISRKT